MNIKLTKALEITGNVLGYIPGVSTIAGVIKAIVYYNRSKGSAGNPAQQQMTKTADKIDSTLRTVNIGIFGTPGKITIPFDSAEQKIYSEICKTSLKEMIPLVNIFYAVIESIRLSELNNIRNMKSGGFKPQVDYLVESYKVLPIKEDPSDPKKRDFFSHTLVAIHNLDLKETYKRTFNEDGVSRDPEYISIKKVKMDLYEECCKNYDKNSNATPTDQLKIYLKKEIDKLRASEEAAELSRPQPPVALIPDYKFHNSLWHFNQERTHNKNLLESMESELAKLD